MTKNQTNQVKEALLGLYQSKRPFLKAYAWEWEKDRWNELIFALFHEGLSLPSEVSRKAVSVMDQLQICSASEISGADAETRAFMERVLCQIGVSKDTSPKAVTVLVAFSHVVEKNWAGYVQRFLRDEGRKIVEKLQRSIIECGVDSAKSERAATLWLQNTGNFPLLLREENVRNFCSTHAISQSDLYDIADDLGINVSVLDDLLALEVADTMSSPEHS